MRVDPRHAGSDRLRVRAYESNRESSAAEPLCDGQVLELGDLHILVSIEEGTLE